MAHSNTQVSTSNASTQSTKVQASEDGTPGRYTCYDTGSFLALYIVLATTSTLDAASEAFEQGENVSKAHQKIQITDAHVGLARRPSSKGRGPEQADGKVKGRMGLRVGGLIKKVVLMKEVVRDMKGEQ